MSDKIKTDLPVTSGESDKLIQCSEKHEAEAPSKEFKLLDEYVISSSLAEDLATGQVVLVALAYIQPESSFSSSGEEVVRGLLGRCCMYVFN